MEPILTGPPQFILASINALITATVARYVMALEDRFRKKGELHCKLKTQWYLMLFGWFIVAFSALLVLIRVILQCAWSIECGQFDIVPISLTLIGYILLMTVNIIAWDLRPWRTK